MLLGIVERDALRAGAVASIRAILNKAEALYDLKFEDPVVDFAKRGKVAATANSATWTININEGLYHRNIGDFISDTIPHEVAHLVADRVAGRRCKHDPFWESVARSLGVSRGNVRYHDYDVSETKVKQRRRRWQYKCPVCLKDSFRLSTVKHNRMKSGSHQYGCTNGHAWTKLIFMRQAETRKD